MRRPSTTREERVYHVAQMRANFALESMSTQADDFELQQRYIDGKIGLNEMLEHARNFARNVAQRGSVRQS